MTWYKSWLEGSSGVLQPSVLCGAGLLPRGQASSGFAERIPRLGMGIPPLHGACSCAPSEKRPS